MICCKKWRLFRQMSLRTLLLIMTIASAIFSFVGYKIRQMQQQRMAVAEFRKVGGRVIYKFQFVSGKYVASASPPGPEVVRRLLGVDFVSNVTNVSLSGTNAADEELGYVSGAPTIVSLDVRETRITDCGLVNLECLTGLRRLDLSGTSIGDTGLRSLRGLVQLRELYLDDTETTDVGLRNLSGLNCLELLRLDRTSVSDAGMSFIRQFTKLQELHLHWTLISDSGLTHLAGLKELKVLSLGSTDVTDKGLISLHTMKELQYLSVTNTSVTKHGCEELRRALPHLKIVR